MEEEVDPPEFLLAPLTSPQKLKVWQFLDMEKSSFSMEGLHFAAVTAVKDWRNVTDDKGDIAKCNNVTLDTLPPEIIVEIGAEVTRRAVLDDGEAKN